MRIAVVGAGNIGGNLARRLAGLGHQVTVANSRAPGTLAALAAQANARAALASQAAAGADLVIMRSRSGPSPRCQPSSSTGRPPAYQSWTPATTTRASGTG